MVSLEEAEGEAAPGAPKGRSGWDRKEVRGSCGPLPSLEGPRNQHSEQRASASRLQEQAAGCPAPPPITALGPT